LQSSVAHWFRYVVFLALPAGELFSRSFFTVVSGVFKIYTFRSLTTRAVSFFEQVRSIFVIVDIVVAAVVAATL
jgi:hypothetical protein